MATTVANTWQPVYSSIKILYSRLELNTQTWTIMNVAHTLIAIGKSRRQYMNPCTRPLGSIFCLFFPPPPLQIYFSSHAIPTKTNAVLFCGSNFLTLLCRMCPSCVVCHSNLMCSICNSDVLHLWSLPWDVCRCHSTITTCDHLVVGQCMATVVCTICHTYWFNHGKQICSHLASTIV